MEGESNGCGRNTRLERAADGDAEALFLQGYGATTLDPLAFTYYRYAWAVSDIGAYGAQVVLRPDLGVVSRRAAVGQFLSLFQPDRIIVLALASDEGAA